MSSKETILLNCMGTKKMTAALADNPYHDPFGGSPEHRACYEYRLASDCILPFLARWGIDVEGIRALDLGCGSGGLSIALAERGAHCLGVDVSEKRICAALKMAAQRGVTVQFRVGDIQEMEHFKVPFDLVILAEVAEHLRSWRNVEVLLQWCREHLAAGGGIYVSFPPWLSPFAGHQAGWPVIRFVPWYHLLPDRSKRVLVPRHAPRYIEFVQGLNHLTLRVFERIVRRVGLAIDRQELYHLRPEFHLRYKLPIVRSTFLARLPIVREVTTTGAYYLLTNT